MQYIILKNKSILLGPMDWNPVFFQNILKIRDINVIFPKEQPSTYLNLDNDIEVYPVSHIEQPACDLIYSEYSGPFWELTDTVAIGKYLVIDKPLPKIKLALKNIVATNRYNKEVEGVVINIKDQSVTCDTSRAGRLSFMQKIITIGDDDSTLWKFKEGWVLLSKNDINAITTKISEYVQDQFNKESELVTLIEQADSIAELRSISLEW